MDQSVEEQRTFGHWFQLRYTTTLVVADPAWRYRRRADEAEAILSIEEAGGDMHGRSGNFVSDTKFASWHCRKRETGRVRWNFRIF